MSFKDNQEFSLLASREKQHGQYLRKPLSYMPRILPIAAIFGANASGKSNFFEALQFIQHFLVQGTQPEGLIPVKPYRLDASYLNKPSNFNFLILIDKNIYSYSITLSRERVCEEQLVLIQSKTEKVLFKRQGEDIQFPSNRENTDLTHLRYIAQSTRHNQAFLTTSIQLNSKEYHDLYQWFFKNLVLISPNACSNNIAEIAQGTHSYSPQFNDILSTLDTQISKLALIPITVEQSGIPRAFLNNLLKINRENKSLFINGADGQRYTLENIEGEATLKKVVAMHQTEQGEEIAFELSDESDGTRRMIDLLPALLDLSDKRSEKVFFIDELDRSLHTLLTRRFVELFLAQCDGNSKGQLIFSSHDLMLFTQDIFRRDELWLSEKSKQGTTCLYSVAEFKNTRYDEILRKSYLDGRMGGIPIML